MSLLADLRLAPTTTGDAGEPWRLLPDGLRLLLPGSEVSDATLLRGAVQVRGRFPGPSGPRHFLALLANDDDSARVARGEHVPPSFARLGLPPEGTDRLLRIGVSSAKYEVDGNFYSSPFVSWVRPAPGAVAVRVAGVLLTARNDWPG